MVKPKPWLGSEGEIKAVWLGSEGGIKAAWIKAACMVLKEGGR
jgi:hypothetical protein